MKRVATALAFMLLLVSVPLQAQSPAAQQAVTPLKEIGDIVVGRWTGEGIYAADYPGIGKKGEKFTCTITCRWVAGQAAIQCEGIENKTSWTSFYWWDAAAKQVKTVGINSGGNWDEGTIAKQGAKLVWASTGSFADGRHVEYKGETTFRDNGNTRIETGATILNGVRNEFQDTYKRVQK